MGCLIASVLCVPWLQDLAIMFVDRVKGPRSAPWTHGAPSHQPPNFMWLLPGIAASCPVCKRPQKQQFATCQCAQRLSRINTLEEAAADCIRVN